MAVNVLLKLNGKYRTTSARVGSHLPLVAVHACDEIYMEDEDGIYRSLKNGEHRDRMLSAEDAVVWILKSTKLTLIEQIEFSLGWI